MSGPLFGPVCYHTECIFLLIGAVLLVVVLTKMSFIKNTTIDSIM